MAGVFLDFPISLSAEYFGQATGSFADPGSFAAYLLILLPCFSIAAFVPRLSMILRVFCFYIALILVVGIALTQTYWAALSVISVMAIVPWFCFEKRVSRFLFSLLGMTSALAVFFAMYLFNPLFERGLERSLTPEGEGIRLVLWQEVLRNISSSPLLGKGAGSFSYSVEHSPDLILAALPLTPHNDILMVLNGYGLIGAVLLFLPLAYILIKALRRWAGEPFKLKTQEGNLTMPTQKFFLSLGICSGFGLVLCAAMHFPLYVPALLLYGVLIVSILAKNTARYSVPIPSFRFSGFIYLATFSTLGFVFWAHASLSLESQGLELQGKQRLETIVEGGIAVSGNFELVDEVIRIFENALISNPGNADAWIGKSMAICQLHYRMPGNFESTGARAVSAAAHAYEISPEYWLASAQLGVALALSGQTEEARAALKRAMELAPNSSNAHYYYAAFLSAEPDKRDEALVHVRRALDIDPSSTVARRLEQKLLIL